MANQKCECGCGKVVNGKGRSYFRGHKNKKVSKPKANGLVIPSGIRGAVSALDHEIGKLTAKLSKLHEARRIINGMAA